jgi:hypothetical protein
MNAVPIEAPSPPALGRRPNGQLNRYFHAIEVERGDYNGQVLTFRRSDGIALASILRCRPDQVPARLHDLGVRLTL